MTGMHALEDAGLPGRIAAFFAANPGEELQYADAQAKFGCTPVQLSAALARLRALRRVEVVRVIRGASA